MQASSVTFSLLCRMAGADGVDESKLTGMSKYFNGNTMRGRANVRRLQHNLIETTKNNKFIIILMSL